MNTRNRAANEGWAQLTPACVRRFSLACGLLLALVGCGPASSGHTPVLVASTPTAAATETPPVSTPTTRLTPVPAPTVAATRSATATATPRFRGDCGWRGEFYTWVDANANGVVDEGEPPLPGVAIRRENILTGATGTLGVSDSRGVFYAESLLGGCPEVKFVVSAQAPPGYRATTPERVPEDPASRQLGAKYSFGFAQVSSPPPP